MRYKEAVPPSVSPVAKEDFGRLLVKIFGDNGIKKKRKTCHYGTRKCKQNSLINEKFPCFSKPEGHSANMHVGGGFIL